MSAIFRRSSPLSPARRGLPEDACMGLIAAIWPTHDTGGISAETRTPAAGFVAIRKCY